MISIIIPACNEEKVIASALYPLIEGVASGALEIIVVCNGCTDNTAGIVASFGEKVKCLETSVSSKTNALNIGDGAARGFPRIYQDADVVITVEAVKRLAFALQSGRCFAVAPSLQMNTINSSWSVRAYYSIWQQLPYVKEGMIGVGVYALSVEGRSRFEEFPSIIADDRYIRALFKGSERSVVDSCCSVVKAPTNIQGLLKIKTRSRLGGYEFEQKFPELIGNEKKNYSQAVFGVMKKIRYWPALMIYLFVNVCTRYRARRQLCRGSLDIWERDDTSRNI
jgi:glycosyltransferase involved in cell wall biosynthesis